MTFWKQRWMKRSLVALAATTVLVGGLAACSHRAGHDHGSMTEADMTELREKMIGKAERALSLDAAQTAKLGLLADALKAQRAALMPGGVMPRAELQGLVAGTTFDRARALALVEAKTSAVRDQAPAVVTAMADFYDSLQPAQQQQLRELMNRGRGWRRG